MYLKDISYKVIMKKILAMVMMMVLCVGLVTGCSKAKDDNTNVNTQATVTPETQENEASGNQAEATTTPTLTPTEEVVDSSEKIDINVAALKGPTAIGMAKIMKDSKNGEAAHNYNFTIAGAADEITAGIISGDIQIAAIPSNLASVLYNKTKGGIKVAGINTLGVLYLVETGDTIHSVEDLKGKTIYSTGKGTTPEFTLNYLLKSAGIDPVNDVTIEFKSEATEVAAILSEASDAVAMLPQPYVTTVMMQNEAVRIALDVTEEWEKLSDDGSTVVTGVVVVNSKFLEENEAAVKTFLDEYSTSVAFVNDNVEEAASIVEEFDIVKAAVATKAIPYCNITLIEGDEMKEKIAGYLNVLFEQEPNSVGGALPLDDFYYMK